MSKVRRWVMVAAVLLVSGCAHPPPKVVSPATSEFKTNVMAPAGLARVYILPTLSKGMYSDLEGRAGIAIFYDGSEKGAPLAWTAKSTFIGFDITPGTYDLLAYTSSTVTKFTKSLTFESGAVYFLRPTFFRSMKDLSTSGSGTSASSNGMTFEPVPAAVGRAEIQRMDMSNLRTEGQNFLAQAQARRMPAQQTAAPVYIPAPVVSQPPDTDFKGVEQKLMELRQLFQKGLITKEDYDAKRQGILNVY